MYVFRIKINYKLKKLQIPPQVYIQDKFTESNDKSIYTHQNPLLTKPIQQSHQYYIQDTQSQLQNDYAPQQQLYQQKTVAGNNLQSTELKTRKLKDDEGNNKGE
jgi:hypothetical protein